MAELWGGVVSRTINRAWALAIGFGLWAAIAQAHPGGLDGHGCHHDRKRSGYHCHRAPQRATLAKAPQTLSGRGAFANCTQARAAQLLAWGVDSVITDAVDKIPPKD